MCFSFAGEDFLHVNTSLRLDLGRGSLMRVIVGHTGSAHENLWVPPKKPMDLWLKMITMLLVLTQSSNQSATNVASSFNVVQSPCPRRLCRTLGLCPRVPWQDRLLGGHFTIQNALDNNEGARQK